MGRTVRLASLGVLLVALASAGEDRVAGEKKPEVPLLEELEQSSRTGPTPEESARELPKRMTVCVDRTGKRCWTETEGKRCEEAGGVPYGTAETSEGSRRLSEAPRGVLGGGPEVKGDSRKVEIEVEILYEDEFLLAVNKPPRLAVHATSDPGRPNLQDWLEWKTGRKLVLFHRLDADTTGVLLLGKKRVVNAAMAEIFARHRIRKTYWAVVRGRWRRSWNRIETTFVRRRGERIRPVTAVSTFRVLSQSEEKTWLEVLPKTGRTHQIRLQCAMRGHPVLGDPRHDREAVPGTPMALHAVRVDFPHPLSGEPLRVVAAPPEYWRTVWLRGLEAEEILARALSS
ncbi:MAG: hypothetical protein KatS3mg076_3195 [Candidatus Binatia bacterium]|nr:MAG: hypothetical protein KatS3mg076_3195 [Candidatus Binatia bacterium]